MSKQEVDTVDTASIVNVLFGNITKEKIQAFIDQNNKIKESINAASEALKKALKNDPNALDMALKSLENGDNAKQAEEQIREKIGVALLHAANVAGIKLPKTKKSGTIGAPPKSIEDRKTEILEVIGSGKLTAKEIAGKTGVNLLTVGKVLKALEKDKKIIGSKRAKKEKQKGISPTEYSKV